MLEQLKAQATTKDRLFKNEFIRMLMFMRIVQFLISQFQDDDVVKEGTEYKQLKRFSQEVHSKMEWFLTVVKKMAGDNAGVIDEELSFDTDKLCEIMNITEFVALKSSTTEMIEMLTSATQRKKLFQAAWESSRFAVSPELQVSQEEFDKWYEDKFPTAILSSN